MTPSLRGDIHSRLGSVPGAVVGSIAEMDAGGPQLDAYGRVFKIMDFYPEVAGGHLSAETTASDSVSFPSSRGRSGLFRVSIEEQIRTPPRRDGLLLAEKFKPEVAVGRTGLVLREPGERIREAMGKRFGGEMVVYRDDTLPDSLPPQTGPPGGPVPPSRPLPWS